MRTPSKESDLWQVIGILRRFAELGDEEARRAIYGAFDRNVTGDNVNDADELIALDGIGGFLHAFTMLGDKQPDLQEWWQFDSWIEGLEERDGEAEAWAALQEAARLNATLAAWLAVREHHRANLKEKWANHRQSTPCMRFGEIALLVAESAALEWRENRGKLRSAGRWAKPATVKRAAAALAEETDGGRLNRWVQFFTTTPFPGDPNKLLERTYDEGEYVRFDAALALSRVSHPDVRVRALGLADEQGREVECVRLLESNFRAGDEALLNRLLDRLVSEDDRHWAVMSIRRIQEQENISDDLLIRAYEITPCSICRGGIVDGLIEESRLPAWIHEECEWDAYHSTREAVLELKARADRRID